MKVFEHYLPTVGLAKVSKVLESPKWEPEFGGGYAFEENEMAERFEHIMATRRNLISELDNLTRV